jgi:hypothetical protein
MGNDNNTPKVGPVHPEYWMVGYRYQIVVEVPVTDSQGQPVIGQSQQYMKVEEGNDVIPVHPMLHAINMLHQGRLNYVINMAIPIPKRFYDAVIASLTKDQTITKAIIDKVVGEQDGNAQG